MMNFENKETNTKRIKTFSEARAIQLELKEKGVKCYIEEFYDYNGKFYEIVILL